MLLGSDDSSSTQALEYLANHVGNCAGVLDPWLWSGPALAEVNWGVKQQCKIDWPIDHTLPLWLFQVNENKHLLKNVDNLMDLRV